MGDSTQKSTSEKQQKAGTVNTENRQTGNESGTGEGTDAKSDPPEQSAKRSDGSQDLGDAGKQALQREREAREGAEKQSRAIRDELDSFKATLAQAFGLGEKQERTSEQWAEELQQAQGTTKQVQAENAVLRAGAGIADLDALLDSRRFTDSLADLDVSDGAKVKAHIEKFVEDYPHYKAGGRGTAGARDAAAGQRRDQLPEPPPGTARMAQGFEAEIDKGTKG